MSTATATAPNPTETGKSFADLIPDLSGLPDGPESTPEPEATPEPAKEPEKSAVKAPETAEVRAEPGANPHLDAEPEPTAKAPAVADDEIPKGMTAKAQETWKGLKASEKAAIAERDSVKAEIATLKKQLEEAGKTGPEVERLKTEREELAARLSEHENEIALTRVEATAQFKSQVSGPIKTSEESVKALATKYDIGASALLEAIREPDAEKRADLLSELSSDFKAYDSKRLFDAADAYANASKAGDEMRANAKTKLTELEKQSEQEAERNATANITDYRKAASDEWKALQEIHPSLRPFEGKPEWNAYLDGIRQGIESKNVNDMPVSEVAQMSARAAALPEVAKVAAHFQKQYKEEREKRIAAETRLGEYRQATPGAGVGDTGGETSSSGGTFADLLPV